MTVSESKNSDRIAFRWLHPSLCSVRAGIVMQVALIVVMHAIAFGILFVVIVPNHFTVGKQVFSVGLALTAYIFGLRHAFDADHIAAIDNTTRKLTNDGKRPQSVGFWFAMGHSTIVFALAILVVIGARAVTTLTDDDSPVRRALGIVSTAASGSFLYLIALINIVALMAIWRVFRSLRTGNFDLEELEHALAGRGLLARILAPIMRRITHPVQMYPLGLLFGLGFDTATEVSLLALAGTGAVAGLPWYTILVLPLLFACGMSLMDTADGMFMSVAYDWALASPVRKIYYNLTITGLSVAVAVLVGTIELVGVFHDDLGWDDAVVDWISRIDLNTAGMAIVGMFVVTWGLAIAYWKLANLEDRYSIMGK